MLYDLAHEEKTDLNFRQRNLCSLIQVEIMDLVPPEAAARFDPGEINERNLSLAHQRQILGEGQFITRGAHTDINLNEILHRDMHAICDYVCAEAEKEIQGHLPTDVTDPNDERWVVRDQFLADIRRAGIIVNDHFLPPGKTNAENNKAFVDLLDRRSAVVLSMVANQVLPLILTEALRYVPGRQNAPQGLGAAQATSEGNVLDDAIWVDPALMGVGSDSKSVRIDSLGDNRFRVSYSVTKIASNNGEVSPNGAERSLTEVSIDVVMGNPPALPTVENARVDLLLRGYAAVPGETLPPAAPPPSGTALRPPARRPT
jgi:hypothetical protein